MTSPLLASSGIVVPVALARRQVSKTGLAVDAELKRGTEAKGVVPVGAGADAVAVAEGGVAVRHAALFAASAHGDAVLAEHLVAEEVAPERVGYLAAVGVSDNGCDTSEGDDKAELDSQAEHAVAAHTRELTSDRRLVARHEITLELRSLPVSVEALRTPHGLFSQSFAVEAA